MFNTQKYINMHVATMQTDRNDATSMYVSIDIESV